ARKDKISQDDRHGLESWLEGMAGCSFIRGHARFEAPHTIRVGDQVLEADRIFLNVGGRATAPPIPGLDDVDYLTNVGILGLDVAGIETDERGYVVVDDELRMTVDGVWAMGDCIGKGAFTHTSYNDFEIVAANLLDEDPRRVSDRVPTYALYVDPPLGRAG